MRFTTAAPLGAGATGEVLEAWDPKLKRKIALELLHRDNPEALAAMLREARAQARVDHPNVGKVYEVGELDGRPYIAMQLVAGKPLDEALVERSRRAQGATGGGRAGRGPARTRAPRGQPERGGEGAQDRAVDVVSADAGVGVGDG